MAYIVILINIIINWGVIFFLTGLVWNIFGYPGDRMVMYVSGCITFALILLGISSIGERLAVAMEGYRKPDIYEQYFILPQLAAVCQVAEVPIPALYINDCRGVNARAIGRHTIVVNSGAVNKIPLEELRGILAHEIGHLVYKDSARLHIIYMLNVVGNCTAAISRPMTSPDEDGTPIILLPFVVLVWFLRIIQVTLLSILKLGDLAVGRREELRADQYAKKLGYGEGLSQYLRKLPDFHKNQSILYKTHPPKQLRIKRLESS